jgi:hypothetical protein
MARFHRASVPLEWEQGPMPNTAVTLGHEGSHPAVPWERHDPDWYSRALTHHGETRYGLEVRPDSDAAGWFWHMHRQTGPDIENPEHWENMGTGRLRCSLCHPDDPPARDLVDPRYYGFLHETGEEGITVEGEQMAQEAAEKAFGRYVTEQNAQRDVNLSRGTDIDDDYGDIFGGGK